MIGRAFYTDTMAAAWMMAHHGLLFEREDGKTCSADLLHLAAFQQGIKWFVHEDSLDLLEPRAGDMVLLASGHEAYLHVKPTTLDPGERIIMRSGVPFLWPEGA